LAARQIIVGLSGTGDIADRRQSRTWKIQANKGNENPRRAVHGKQEGESNVVKRGKKKVIKLSVNVEDIEKRSLIAEGEYEVAVVDIEEKASSKDNQYIKWTLEIVDGEFKSQKLYTNTMLTDQSMHWLAEWLDAIGSDIEGDEIRLEDVEGLTVMVEVEHEKYQGKPQARVVNYWPVEEEGKGSKGKEADRKGKGGKEKEQITEDKVNDMDSEELEAVKKEFKLRVDLDEFATTKKKRAALLDAAEKAGVLAA
jgi:hypothetical protein